jgi:hypothetical protein
MKNIEERFGVPPPREMATANKDQIHGDALGTGYCVPRNEMPSHKPGISRSERSVAMRESLAARVRPCGAGAGHDCVCARDAARPKKAHGQAIAAGAARHDDGIDYITMAQDKGAGFRPGPIKIAVDRFVQIPPGLNDQATWQSGIDKDERHTLCRWSAGMHHGQDTGRGSSTLDAKNHRPLQFRLMCPQNTHALSPR